MATGSGTSAGSQIPGRTETPYYLWGTVAWPCKLPCGGEVSLHPAVARAFTASRHTGLLPQHSLSHSTGAI